MSDYRYKPRRQSKRWLDTDCPRGVLAIYDNGGLEKRNGSLDRYTVFYVDVSVGPNGEPWIGYRGMSENPSSPQGFGIYGEMRAYQVAEYRERVRRQACKWSSLPEAVKRVVRKDCAPH